jgi:hypothetical protein
MNTKRFVLKLLAVWLSASFWHIYSADGAILFSAGSIVANAKESEVLSPEERKILETMRGRRVGASRVYADMTVVRPNKTAFDSAVLTIITPKGKEFQYVGERKQLSNDKYIWQGKSRTGTLMAVVGDTGIYGEFNEDSRTYGFMSFGSGGNAALIYEILPQGAWSEGASVPEAAPNSPPPPESFPKRN